MTIGQEGEWIGAGEHYMAHVEFEMHFRRVAMRQQQGERCRPVVQGGKFDVVVVIADREAMSCGAIGDDVEPLRIPAPIVGGELVCEECRRALLRW